MFGKFSRRHFAKLAGFSALGMAATPAKTQARRGRTSARPARACEFSRAALSGARRPPRIRSKAPSMKTAADARSGTLSATRRARSRIDTNGDRANDHYHRYKEDVGLIKGSGGQGLSVFDRVAAGVSGRRRGAKSQRPRFLQPPAGRTSGQRHRTLCDAVSLGFAASAAGSRRRMAVQRHLQGIRGLRGLCRRAPDRSRQDTSSRSTNPADS